MDGQVVSYKAEATPGLPPQVAEDVVARRIGVSFLKAAQSSLRERVRSSDLARLKVTTEGRSAMESMVAQKLPSSTKQVNKCL